MSKPAVVIWHAKEDKKFVEEELAPLLRDAGFKTACPRGRKGKGPRPDAGAVWYVVVVSPASVGSGHVRDGAAGALGGSMTRVIPVTVGGCRPADLHPLLAGAAAADFTSHRKRARKRLRALLAAGAAPADVRRLADVTAGPGAVTRAAAFRLRSAHTLAVACRRPGEGLTVAVVLDGEELFRQEFRTPVARWAQRFRVEGADGLVSVVSVGSGYEVRVTVGGVEVLRV